jgi:UDP-N-acetylmuramyl pentapeptide phosphotransferase/UDP-N-acetylglucosamine-1-phosphate transferase
MNVNELMRPAILFGFVFVLSLLFTGLATRYSRWRGLIDHPGERHSHTVSTPRGGGLGLVLALLLTSILFLTSELNIWLEAILPGMVLLSLLGWWDDHSSLSARFRFFVQLVVSFYLLWCIVGLGWGASAGLLIVAGLFVLWMTNSYNFMDGSNGMAGSQGVFAGIVLAALYCQSGNIQLALVSGMLAASCLGFLPWNIGQARVFMGDAGSLPLGFGFGSLLIYGVAMNEISLPVALLVMLVFLADASMTLLVRVLKGEQWYNPHRQHLYQRLIASGRTHGSVLIFYQAINLMLVVPGIVVAVSFPALAWVVTLVLVLAFGTGWCLMIRKTGVLVRAE